MRRLAPFLLVVLLVLSGCRREAPRFVVLGYHAWWMGDAWTDYDLAALDELVFFDLSVGPDGSLTATNGWPDDWRPMVAAASAAGTRVAPTLSLFDADVFRQLFTDEEAQARLFEAAVAAVHSAGASGLHVDFELFEDVPEAAREAFPRFVARLNEALGDSAAVSVYTLAFDEADRYDERALALAADFLVVQGYDFHWMQGPRAGPNSPLEGWGGLNWEAVMARYDELGVPRRQILMATPFYGYEWPTEHGEIGSPTRGEGRIIAYAPTDARVPELGQAASDLARRHGLRRDPESGSPFYAYEAEDGWVQGWFDDAESLEAKFDFVKTNRLGGVALFPMGYDGGAFASLVREAFPDSLRARQPLAPPL